MSDFLSWLWVAVGWSVVWQSTLALAAGLLATAICRRRPARADGLLVASVVAALTAPAGTFVVHELGWGVLLPRTAPTAAIPLADLEESKATAPLAPPDDAPAPAASRAVQFAAAGDPVVTRTSSSFALRKSVLSQSERRPNAPPALARSTYAPPTWLAIWLVMSAAALARLGAAVWAGRQLLVGSDPLHNALIDRALASAAERLRLDVKVETRVSARVRCPVIWCWSRRPVILLPVGFVSLTDESAWLGIFCHELAHWKRGDHLSSLAADLLCCLAPWQPLAWSVARRHDQLSELACDEWVLAAGQSAESYADSLLDLMPQRGGALALAVLRNRAGLAGRIRHILRIAHAQPALGRRWFVTVASSTLALVALVALAQQKPRAAGDTRAVTVSTEGATADAANSESAIGRSQSVSGVVLDLSEKPVVGARLYWVGLTRVEWSTLPHDDSRQQQIVSLAEGVTDDRGHFAMSSNFDPREFQFPAVVVRHEGHGLGLRSYLAEEPMPLEIHVPEATPIQGQILNANGMPVAGAEVLPVHLAALVRRTKKAAINGAKADSKEDNSWGWLALSDAARCNGALPDVWPKAVKTDADGRFTISGSDNCGTALLRIAAKGFGPHGVTVTDAEALVEWENRKPGRDQSPPLANNFTLVLEPPRAIEGTFSDAQTGLPVAGVEVVMESTGHAGYIWNRQIARATSDEQGRYRFLAPATGREQHFHIYPPLGYAPLGGRVYLEREFAELFGNDRVYRNDIRLTPGRVVRGRVIDADNRAPVRDAAVLYRPGPENPNIDGGDYWFHEPVLTDDDGSFQITALRGGGVISVDTRSEKHIRATIPHDIAGGRSDVNPHAFVAIDVTDTGEIAPLELEVRRGTDLVVEPTGPYGKSIDVVSIAYREVWAPVTHTSMRSRHLRETPLRLPGCEPGKTYRLLIGTPDCDLGAVADVVCDSASKPVKISLQSTGALRGKLIYADGTPASEIHTFLRFRDDPPATAGANESAEARKAAAMIARNLPYYNNVVRFKGERSTTDANGQFEIRGIVPGVFLYLTVNYDFASGENFQPAGMIEPGKTLDMGELIVKP